MKFVILLFFLINVSLNSAKQGSTVLDNLRNGFDAVYKYQAFMKFSIGGVKLYEGETFDVHVRKSAQSPRNFVLHLENLQLQGQHDEPPTKADVAASVLPITVSPDTEDLEMFHIATRERETDKSLYWKDSALILLMQNYTEQVLGAQLANLLGQSIPISYDMNMPGLPLGHCKLRISSNTIDGRYIFESSTRRENCTGQLHKKLHRIVNKNNAKDMFGGSELRQRYEFNIKSGKFIRASSAFTGFIMNDDGAPISFEMHLEFVGYKKIQMVFDEKKDTKKYSSTDLTEMNFRDFTKKFSHFGFT